MGVQRKKQDEEAMGNLFEDQESRIAWENAPLAARMRPKTLEEFVGQEKAVGPNSWLRRAIEHDALSSILLYGPAGTGKTTLARIIANVTRGTFVEVSAVTGTVKDLRTEIEAAKNRLLTTGKRTILFIDEIHRFNKSQQDALLHAVEDRTVVLIGATTENPYFEVNSALISRSRVIELAPLSASDIAQLIARAVVSPNGLNNRYSLDDAALQAIVTLSAGDARAALTTLELAAQMATDPPAKDGEATGQALDGEDKEAGGKKDSGKGKREGGIGKIEAGEGKTPSISITEKAPSIPITVQNIEEATPRRGLPYDKGGDMHYDVISAFIKSMRGSDPDAALYWLARMIDAGEDPRFIARRILICASEDIGNADPQAILVAEAAFKAAEVIGYPECQINLAQAATYLALAPKSNAAVEGINRALSEVRSGPCREVPAPLRDRHRPGAEEYGTYYYPHLWEEGWVAQQYLPDGLESGAFFSASKRGWEAERTVALNKLKGEQNTKKNTRK